MSSYVSKYKSVSKKWIKNAKFKNRKIVFSIRNISNGYIKKGFSVWNVMAFTALFYNYKMCKFIIYICFDIQKCIKKKL